MNEQYAEAKQTLAHYLWRAFIAGGMDWNDDSTREIDGLVDAIVGPLERRQDTLKAEVMEALHVGGMVWRDERDALEGARNRTLASLETRVDYLADTTQALIVRIKVMEGRLEALERSVDGWTKAGPGSYGANLVEHEGGPG